MVYNTEAHTMVCNTEAHTHIAAPNKGQRPPVHPPLPDRRAGPFGRFVDESQKRIPRGSTVTVLHCIGSMNAGSVHFEFGDASSLRDSLSRGLVEVLFRGFGEREDGRQGALV